MAATGRLRRRQWSAIAPATGTATRPTVRPRAVAVQQLATASATAERTVETTGDKVKAKARSSAIRLGQGWRNRSSPARLVARSGPPRPPFALAPPPPLEPLILRRPRRPPGLPGGGRGEPPPAVVLSAVAAVLPALLLGALVGVDVSIIVGASCSSPPGPRNVRGVAARAVGDPLDRIDAWPIENTQEPGSRTSPRASPRPSG